MLTNDELRSEFKEALEAVTPPAPWLPAAIEQAWLADHAGKRRIRVARVPAGAMAFIALLLVAALVAGLIGIRVLIGPQTVGPGPEVPSAPNSRGSIFFDTAELGWMISTPGQQDGSPAVVVIFRTTDGGVHWRRWGSVTNPRVPSHMGYSPAYPIALGGAGAILVMPNGGGCTGGPDCQNPALPSWTLVRSSDGSHWASYPVPFGDPTGGSMSFLPDLEHGWYVGAIRTGAQSSVQGFFYTSDGGRNWSLRPVPVPGGCCPTFWTASWGAHTGQDIGFDGNNGWGPLVEVTHDGGVTWGQTVVDIPNFQVEDQYGAGPLSMLDDSRGLLPIYVSSRDSGELQPVVYVSRTADGAESWSTPSVVHMPQGWLDTPCESVQGCPVTAPFRQLPELIFLDDSHWLAVGRGIFASDDAGRNWQSITTTIPAAASQSKQATGCCKGEVEIVRGQTPILFAIWGGYVSTSIDWGHHWRAVSVPAVSSGFGGVGGLGGW